VYCTTIVVKMFKIVVGRCNYNVRSRYIELFLGSFGGFFSDVEVCPLFVQPSGAVRVVNIRYDERILCIVE